MVDPAIGMVSIKFFLGLLLLLPRPPSEAIRGRLQVRGLPGQSVRAAAHAGEALRRAVLVAALRQGALAVPPRARAELGPGATRQLMAPRGCS